MVWVAGFLGFKCGFGIILQRGAKTRKANTDHWINNGQVFVTEGKAYGVDKTGATVCLGEEKDVIKNTDPDTPGEKEQKVTMGTRRRARK